MFHERYEQRHGRVAYSRLEIEKEEFIELILTD